MTGREEEAAAGTNGQAPDWPNAVSLVLASRTRRQRRWAVETALEVTRKLGASHSKVILADLAAEQPSDLARTLGVEGGDGIVDVLFRGASFSAVARRPEDESFFFLPLGSDPPPPALLFQHPRWQKIAARLADAGAHLLPCVTDDDWLQSGPIPGFEPCILFNGAGLELEQPAGARQLAEFIAPPHIRDETDGVAAVDAEPSEAPDEADASAAARDSLTPAEVEPEGQEATAPPPDLEEEEVGVEPLPSDASPAEEVLSGAAPEVDRAAPDKSVAFSRRRRADRRSLIVAGGLVAAAIAILGLWQLLGGGDGSVEQGPLATAPASDTRPSVDAEAGPERSPAGAEVSGEPAPVEAASGSAVEAETPVALPFSVAIASYSSFEDARERQEEWTRDDVPFYVAPTVVRGVVYYRVFAGLLSDRAAAESLMARLVEAGIKDTVRGWDVRPTRLAFSFGTYANERDARSTVETLQGKGVPAYMIRVPGSGTAAVAFHVYAGGYENPEDARPLRDRIAAAGLDVELVERVGMASR